MQGRGRDREGAQTRCSQLYSPPHTHPFLAAEPKRVVAGTAEGSGCETTPLHTRLPMILGSRPPQHSSMPQGSQAQPQTERPSLQEEGPKGGGMNRDPPGERCQAGGRADGGDRCRGAGTRLAGCSVAQSLCPSKAASLRAVLRPGGRC